MSNVVGPSIYKFGIQDRLWDVLANRLSKAVGCCRPMASFICTLVVIWFHQTGHQLPRFPFRPWYTKKEEPSLADMLTTLRRVSYQEKTPQPLPEQSGLKTWIAQVTEQGK